MIAAGRHPAVTTHRMPPNIRAERERDEASEPSAMPSRLGSVADICCCLAAFAGIGSGALPLLWGLVLHDPPLAASGACASLVCVITLVNRLFAPATARRRAVPYIAALDERPLVTAVCFALGVCAFSLLFAYWPRPGF